MGCCLSTRGGPQGEKLPAKAGPRPRDNSSRAPPPSIEEETVKEVLSSETSKPSIPPSITPRPTSKPSHFDDVDGKPQVQRTDSRLHRDVLQDDCYSEQTASELSSSTVTHDFYDEERDRVKQGRRKVPARPRPEWNAGPGKERAIGRSPTRRSEHSSPARRAAVGGGSVRMVPGKEQSPIPGQNRVRKRGLKFDPDGREGRGSGPLERRSRSPAAHRSGVGNPSSNPSVRRASQSPGRARAAGAGNEDDGGKKNTPHTSNTDGGDSNGNDSLDNPVVSLECFIFL